MNLSHTIAYISRIVYPKNAAHAMQAIQMAAAFARVAGDAHMFVRDLVKPLDEIRRQYALGESPLHLWSLHNRRLPGSVQGYYGHAAVFNSLVAGILAFHPVWRKTNDRRRVIFNRMRQETLYWGGMRPYLPWMRDWILVHEAHDVAGLDPQASLEENPFRLKTNSEGRNRQRLFKALLNYDLLLCVSQALADDLRLWSNGNLQPRVVRHASSLPRLSHPPVLKPMGNRIELGYMGTVDTYRGVDKLILAMRYLPPNYHLRIVGRVAGRSEDGRDSVWLTELLNDPQIHSKVELIPPVPVQQVAEEIDRCDILIQPASNHILTLRYASPLKSFDYMVRGKPIIATDVACHRELLQDEVNSCLYRLDDVHHLADRIQFLANQPRLMETIACKAWEQSADYTYDARARRILELVDEVWERRYAEEHRNAQ